MPETIIFIRHGETDWNKQGLIQGSIDTDLNETGRAQAAHLAQLMLAKAEMLEGFQIICSPQRRAQQTAEAILMALGRDLDATDHRVKELGFGVWEGKPFWELKASPVYPAHPEDRFFWRPELGESYEDGVARVNDWRATLTRPDNGDFTWCRGPLPDGNCGGVGGKGPCEPRNPTGQILRFEARPHAVV